MKLISYQGKKLSKLSLGTVQFGLDYGIANELGRPNQNSVNDIVKYVYDQGINCFDTAQAYGNSESVLGKATKNLKETFFISKIKSNTFLDNLEDSIDVSCTNLNIDTLYGLLLHDSALLYSWKNQYKKQLIKLIDTNKIKYFGVSIYSSKDFELALANESISFIQIPFNLFDQRAVKEKWFEKAKAKNKLIFIRSIYLQGLLLMDINDIPEKLFSSIKYIEQLELLCKKLDISKNELALSYVDTMAKDAILLFGCDNIEQAKENIMNYNSVQDLDPQILEEIHDLFHNIDEKIYNPAKW